ncbi:MAG: cytochrome-c oxidase, cbb3-type subunit III, partial [Alphaproteobacteria bacterium]
MARQSDQRRSDRDPGPRGEHADVGTSGHEWDGIRELNNPLPRWWTWTFYATIVFAIGYWVLYPSWPLINSYTEGVLGHSQRAEVMQAIASAQAAQSGLRQAVLQSSLEEIRQDGDLSQFAIAGGRSAFAVNCSQCHGQGAQGSAGYPNLNDDSWLWGGSLEAIETSIRFGIRSDHPETRLNDMTAFGTLDILSREEIADVAAHVLALSGQTAADGFDQAAAERGAVVFAEQCVACHGPAGTGDRELGAPDLTDALWLYGGDRGSIIESVTNGRAGVMRAWIVRLDVVTVKQLGVGVHAV